MSYEKLSFSGFINEIKDVSNGSHPRKFCFVLGAGASKTSGIKSGQELVNIWDQDLKERNQEEYTRWKNALNITEDNKYSFYSKYYEKRFRRQSADGYNYLEKLMEHAKPSPGYVMLSYILTQTNNNVVITTNFDHLIEDAVNYYSQTIPLVIGHETLAHYVTRQINRPTIVKIHRDLLFSPENTEEEVETLNDSWKKALDLIFMQYNPIFIGYAGNDNSLMDYLLDNKNKFLSGELNFPYWMLYREEKPCGKVLSFVEQSDGYFVRHNGFDEVLYLLGAAFGYKMPSKEDFLDDAEKRFQALANAIDEFTDKMSYVSKPILGPDSVDIKASEIEQAIHQITDQTDLQSRYREAVRLHNAGKYKEALLAKQELLKLDPKNAKYIHSLGVTLHKMKRYKEACVEKQKAIELDPENAKYHDSLSTTLHEMERYDEALIEEQKAIELDPENAKYHDSLSTTLHEMKRYDEAFIEDQKAIELDSENAKYHDSIGVTLHEMKRYEEALIEKQKAIDLDPKNAEYHNSLCITLHEMKRYEEALVEEKEAIRLEPQIAYYHFNCGVTLHEMKCYEEAQAEKQRAVDLEPKNDKFRDSLNKTRKAME